MHPPEPKTSCHIPSAVPQPMGCPFAWLFSHPRVSAALGTAGISVALWWVRLLTLAWVITNLLPPKRGDASCEAVLAVSCHLAFVRDCLNPEFLRLSLLGGRCSPWLELLLLHKCQPVLTNQAQAGRFDPGRISCLLHTGPHRSPQTGLLICNWFGYRCAQAATSLLSR